MTSSDNLYCCVDMHRFLQIIQFCDISEARARCSALLLSEMPMQEAGSGSLSRLRWWWFQSQIRHKHHCFAAQLMTHQLFGNRPVRASAPRTLTMATHKIRKNWTCCHCCLLNGQDAHVTAMSKLVLQSQDYIQARISCSVCITDFISSTHTWMLQNSWDHPCAITIRGWHQPRAHASTLECLMEWDSNGF